MGNRSSHSSGREILAVVLVGLALLLSLSLISYHPNDTGLRAGSESIPVQNFIGPVGAKIALWNYFGFGLAAWVVMLVLIVSGVLILTGQEVSWRTKSIAAVLLVVASCCLLHLIGFTGAVHKLQLPDAGGFVGLIVGNFFVGLLGQAGTFIVFGVLYIISLILLIQLQPSYWLALSAGAIKDFWHNITSRTAKKDLREALVDRERELKLKGSALQREVARQEREARKNAQPALEPKIQDTTQPSTEAKDKKAKPAPDDEEETIITADEPIISEPIISDASVTPMAQAPLPPKKPKPTPASPSPALSSDAADAPYEMPSVELLDQPAAGTRNPTVVEDLKVNAETLRSTLEEFDIPVQIAEVTKGPVVTLYEMIPASGVRVEKIAALTNNIALAMKAVSVRVLTPVPGKGTVGIEVPNTKSTAVYLRDMLESEAWHKSKANIPLALGRDVAGKALIADLADMPHMLIAGATGSGKTVCINAILSAMLYRFGPDQLRLVLIDPKVVEMQHYNVLPHLVVPVVNEPKRVPIALRWVINEMEKRFQIFAKVGVRNISSFNNRPKKKPEPEPESQVEAANSDAPGEPVQKQEELKIEVPRDTDLIIPETVPYIVVVIDELADLMHTVPADVEMAVARLTALGRAAGIHLIVATQRPSVDVVTGVIKSNIPARIAFQVASKQDSRVVLDANGADKLLGKGDMLYLPPGSGKPIRAQGVLVTDAEIHRILEFIGKNAKQQYVPEIHQKLSKATILPDEMTDDADEELVEQALEVIRQTNRASTSIIQRRLRIGYTRAARIMDLLESRGIVGPNKGAEPRDILVDLEGNVPAQ
jgi:S-DNA-T family DNA segregation ATPase FtsK/SpoIIIE